MHKRGANPVWFRASLSGSACYCFVVESLAEAPDFDFELLLSLLLGEAELLPEDEGDASDDELAAEPGAVDAGEDCEPDELSGVACVPYGDLWSDCVPLSGLDDRSATAGLWTTATKSVRKASERALPGRRQPEGSWESVSSVGLLIVRVGHTQMDQ